MESLIKNVQNGCDLLTNFCIEYLTYVCHAIGISYGELNVYLFLVIYPFLLILFIAASLVRNKIIKRILLILGFGIITILIFLFFFFLVAAIVECRTY